MNIPFEPQFLGYPINIHWILESLAFFLSFRYYVYLRKNSKDIISSNNRLSIILGAVIGAYVGSRIIGFLEHPMIDIKTIDFMMLFEIKTIMGGLFGGLIGVETAKKWINETESSGDLFTLPIILGIFIGRIGCFLSGTNEFTYGAETSFFMGMDLGDKVIRHPIALYELLFLVLLFMMMKYLMKNYSFQENGILFKIFMIAYFGFRFFIEFIKPNTFFILGLSTIQWLCMICWFYYFKTFQKLFIHAYKKIYLLRPHY